MTRLFDPPDDRAGPFSGDKILWHPEELRKLAEGEIPSPITAEIDLTNVCDLACPYCSAVNYKRYHETLDPSVVITTVEDLVDLGGKSVVVTGGGEPLIHRQAVQLISYIKYRGLDVALITNGTRLNSVEVESLVEACTWIRISLDSHDAASYAQSKGIQRFEDVRKGIARLVRAREAAHSKTTIGVGYVTHQANFKHLMDAAALASDLGVDYIQARPLIFEPGDARANEYPLHHDEAALQAARLYNREGFAVYASTPKYQDIGEETLAERGYRRCLGIYFATSIGAGGEVWTCCHTRGVERLSLGNVNRESFKTIWQNAERRKAVYGRINLAECMPLCRMHATNKLLDRINWRPTHESFL